MSKYFTFINKDTIDIIREYFTHVDAHIDLLDGLMFHPIGIDLNTMTYKFSSEIYNTEEYELLESKEFIIMLRDAKINNILENG